MKIHVVGCGVVGGALARWLELMTDHVVTKYDPVLGFKDFAFSGTEAVFIAVPAPTISTGVDLTNIHQAIINLPKHIDCPIFIKSTVLPGTCDELTKQYNHPFYSMPEFLTERSALSDFSIQDVITGCKDESFIREIFAHKKNVICVNNTTAEFVKYSHNVFGALKVTYANILFKLSEQMNIEYNQVVSGMLMSRLISHNHLQVPGPDGKYGFGGKCFPKDLEAFLSFNKTINSDKTNDLYIKFFNSILELNKHFRGEEQL